MTDIAPLKAPFPWFGGKSRAADLIWPRFGDVPNYSEPFFGSGAVLLRRPHAAGNEIINDLDCYVANAWRAIKTSPAEVAKHCDWPINEADLHARHRWLHKRTEFRLRMENDPDYYDAKIAAWWVWGLSCWIGDNFCRVADQASQPELRVNRGVTRQLPDIIGTFAAKTHNAQPMGKGINGAIKTTRQRPHVTTHGIGVARSIVTERKRPSLSPWKGTAQAQALVEWFDALADRLRFVKVCCGDWSRVVTKAATYGQGITAILLDPPYSREERDANIYSNEVDGVSDRVREWAIVNGENPLLRIGLCGYEGEHEMPASWECVAWKAAGGYANRNPDNQNAHRERIWFSPHCLKPQPDMFDFT